MAAKKSAKKIDWTMLPTAEQEAYLKQRRDLYKNEVVPTIKALSQSVDDLQLILSGISTHYDWHNFANHDEVRETAEALRALFNAQLTALINQHKQ